MVQPHSALGMLQWPNTSPMGRKGSWGSPFLLSCHWAFRGVFLLVISQSLIGLFLTHWVFLWADVSSLLDLSSFSFVPPNSSGQKNQICWEHLGLQRALMWRKEGHHDLRKILLYRVSTGSLCLSALAVSQKFPTNCTVAVPDELPNMTVFIY